MDPLLTENLITTKSASDLSGYTSDYLARLIRSGKIQGKKIGHTWLIDSVSLERFLGDQKHLKIDRARELAHARVKEYHTHRKFIHRVRRDLTRSFRVPQRVIVSTELRSHAFALSLAFAVVISAATVARAEAIGQVATTVASISQDVLYGFNETFGHLPSRIAAKSDSVVSQMRAQPQIVATRSSLASAHMASPVLSNPDLSFMRLATDCVNEVCVHAAPSIQRSYGSDREMGSIAFDLRTLTSSVVASFASPEHVGDALVRLYRTIGSAGYAASLASLSAYRTFIEDVGAESLAGATSARDSLTRAPNLVAVAGRAIVDATHALIHADVRVAYGIALAAPATAHATVTFIGTTGAVLAGGVSEMPRLAADTYLAMTEAPARIAPALAQAVFGVEYRAAEPFVRATNAIADRYLASLTAAAHFAYEGSVQASKGLQVAQSVIAEAQSTVRETAIAIASASATAEDAYLGTLGRTALALDTFVSRVPMLAAARSALSPDLSIGQQVAVSTYTTISSFFASATDKLALFLAPPPTIVLPSDDSLRAPVVIRVATSSLARTNSYSYPTYTTVVQGVSPSALDASLSTLRGDILSTVAAMVQPVRTQVIQNTTTIQQVNRIEELHDLIVKNGDFRNSIFDNGIRVAATDGNFTNLSVSTFTAGASNLSSTTITGNLTTTGAFSSYTSATAPYFNATSTTATSTFAGGLTVGTSNLVVDYATGRIGIGTTSPWAQLSVNPDGITGPSFAIGSSTSTHLVVTNAGNVGIGTTTPSRKLSIQGSVAGRAYVETNDSTLGYNTLFGTDSSGTAVYATAATQPISFLTNNGSGSTAKMRITSDGNVGVGITAPTALLHVSSTTPGMDLFKVTGGSNNVVINSNGNVGIGTTTPWSKLSVTNTGTGPSFVVEDSTSPDTTPFIIDASGNVGIGTSTPSSELALNGNFMLTGTTTVTGAGSGIVFTGTGNHDITASGGTLRIGSNTIIGNIEALDDTVDIGTPSVRFDKIYANEVNASTVVGTLTGGNLIADTFNINSDNATADTESAYLSFERGSLSPNALLTWNAAGAAKRFEFNQPLFIQSGDASTTLTTFDVKSVAGQTADIFRVASSSSDTFFNVTGAGNVGIGTTSPTAVLTVSPTATTTLTTALTGLLDVTGIVAGASSNSRAINLAPTLSVSASSGIGIRINPTISPSASVGTMYGLADFATVDGSSDITNMYGNLFRLDTASTYTGSITNGTAVFIGSGILSGTKPQTMYGLRIGNQGSAGITTSYGLLVDAQSGSTSNYAAVFSGGNVGISTTSPWGKLSVTNTGTGPSFVVEDSTSPDTTPFIIDASGNVGIGTSSPQHRLVVQTGTNAVSGWFTDGTVSSAIFSGAAGANPAGAWFGSQSNHPVFFNVNGGNPSLTISIAGLVGVGTTSPLAKLDVAGANNGTAPLFQLSSVASYATTTRFIVENGGNVGIGTTSPYSMLSVAGQVVAQNYVATSTTATSTFFGGFSVGNNGAFVVNPGAPANSLHIDNANGYVGLGTSAPTEKLTVSLSSSGLYSPIGTARSPLGTFASIVNTSATAGTFSGISFRATTPGAILEHAWIGAVSAASGYSPSLVFGVSTGSAASQEWARFDTSGNFGLGTSSPLAKLDVAGSNNGTSPLFQLSSVASYATSTRFIVTNAGNVGLGTTTPWGMLSINPNGITGPSFAIGSSTSTHFVVTNGGNVGIGVTTPSSKLEIANTLNVKAMQVVNSASATGVAGINVYSNVVHTGNAGNALLAAQIDNAGSTGTGLYIQNDGTGYSAIFDGGNVGIGTTTPGYKFDVFGGAQRIASGSGASSYAARADSLIFTRTDLPASYMNKITNSMSGAPADTTMNFELANSAGSGFTTVMSLNGTGNVGIGTTTPSEFLSLYASSGSKSIILNTAGGNSNATVKLQNDVHTWEFGNFGSSNDSYQIRNSGKIPFAIEPSASSNSLYINSSGNVGIGTTTPDTALSVNGTTKLGNGAWPTASLTNTNERVGIFSSAELAYLLMGDMRATAAAGNGSIVYLGARSTTGTDNMTWARIGGYKEAGSGTAGSYLRFDTSTSGSSDVERMRITSAGNVGIGTSTPGGKLHVVSGDAGDVSATAAADDFIVEGSSSTQNGISILSPDSAYSYLGFGSPSDNLGSYLRWNYDGNLFEIGSHKSGASLAFKYGADTEGMRLSSTGNLGVGTTSPLARLDVAGSNNGTAPLFQVSSVASYATTTQLIVDSTGNVGIGTTLPRVKLHINGSSALAAIGTEDQLIFDRPFNSGVASGPRASIKMGMGDATSNPMARLDFALTPTGGALPLNSATMPSVTVMTLLGSGNVGIGTTSPFAKLSVHANNGETNKTLFAIASSTASATSTHFVVTNAGNVGIGTTTPGAQLSVEGTLIGIHGRFYDTGTNRGYGSPILYVRTPNDAVSDNTIGMFGVGDNTDTTERGNLFRITQTGNVGIGTTTPWAQLSVNPNGITGPSFAIGSSTSTHFVVTNAGNVGIGTTNPEYPLHVYTSTAGYTMELENDLSTGVAGIYLRDDSGTGRAAFGYANGTFATTELRDSTYFGSLGATPVHMTTDGTIRLTVLATSGNVGIGTTTPAAKLSVQGNALISGDLTVANLTATGTLAISGTLSSSATSTASYFAASTLGFAGAPAFTFSSDLNTGLWSSAADTLNLSTGGTERLRVDSSGNVGIGTTTPGTKLDVFGSGDMFRLGNTSASGYASQAIELGGTTMGRLYGFGSSYTTSGRLVASSFLIDSTATGGLGLSAGSVAPIKFYTSATERMIIDSSGNVGIGTTTPGDKLSIAGSGTQSLSLYNTDTGVGGTVGTSIKMFTETTSGTRVEHSTISSGPWATNSNAGLLTFSTANTSNAVTERMRIIGDGKVGIGTILPSTILTLSEEVSDGDAAISLRSGSGTPGSTREARITAVSTGGGGNGHSLAFSTNISGGAVTEYMRITAEGNIGVGTTSPWAQLSVNPNGITGPSFAIGSSTSTHFVVTNAGNVGIGTTTPMALLSFPQGTTAANGINFGDSSANLYRSASAVIKTDGSFTATANISASGRVGSGAGSLANPSFYAGSDSDTGIGLPGSGIIYFDNNGSQNVTIEASGEVGIGTSTPSTLLTIDSPGSSALSTSQLRVISPSGNVTSGHIVGGIDFYSDDLNITAEAATIRALASGTHTSTSYPTDIVFSTTALTETSSTERMRITGSGSLGIGTTSPLARLDVAGANNGTSPLFQLSSVASYATTTRFIVENGGNVGIGTTTPGGKLSVIDGNVNIYTTSASQYSALRIGVDANTLTGGALYHLNASYSGVGVVTPSTTALVGYESGGLTLGAQSGTGTIRFYTAGPAVSNERMRIDSTGNIGIGTTSPLARLDVTGINNGTAPLFQLSSAAGLATTTRFIVTNAGSVGIGTSSPLGKLEIEGGADSAPQTSGASADFNMRFSPTGTALGLDFGASAGGGVYSWIQSRNTQAYSSSYSLALNPNGGNVGIGTTTPAYSLHVAGIVLSQTPSLTGTLPSLRNTENFIAFRANSGASSSESSIAIIGAAAGASRLSLGDTADVDIGSLNYDHTNDRMEFITNNTTQMVISSAGNLGIGTTSPLAKLDVLNTLGGSTALFSIASSTSGAGTTTAFYVAANGSVGIGTTTPSSTLHIQAASTPELSIQENVAGKARYSFAASTNLATRINGTDYLTLQSDGDFIVNSGNVGIGTSTPGSFVPSGWNSNASSKLLEITSAGTNYDSGLFLRRSDSLTGLDLWSDNSTGDVYIDNYYNNTNGDIYFRTQTSGTPVNAMVITGGGNVGIGTSTPGNPLSISSNTNTISSIDSTLTSGSSRLYFTESGTLKNYFQSIGSAFATTDRQNDLEAISASGDITFWPNSAQSLTLKGSGNVGIGTTSPAGKFAVYAAAGSEFFTKDNSDGLILTNSVASKSIGLSTSQAGTYSGNGSVGIKLLEGAGVANGGTISFLDDGAVGMTYKGGKVGIGTTSPLAQIHVYTGAAGIGAVSSSGDELALEGSGPAGMSIIGGATSDQGIYFGDSTSQTMGRVIYANNTDSLQLWSNATQRVTIDSSGNVGIGTTSPQAKLSLVGSNGAIVLGTDVVAGYGGIWLGTPANMNPSVSNYNMLSANLDTLINRPTGGAIQFRENNTNQMTIATGGSVGIGTTTTNGQLTVYGGGQATASWSPTGNLGGTVTIIDSTSAVGNGGALIFGGKNTNSHYGAGIKALDQNSSVGNSISTTDLAFLTGINGDSTLTERMRITSTGSVGIGSTTPWAQLSVNPNGITGPSFAIGSSTSTHFVVTNGGNVGIGTTTPSGTLAITDSGAGSMYSLVINNRFRFRGDAVMTWGSTSNAGLLSWTGTTAIMGAQSGFDLSLRANGNDAMRISTSGSVGIGTTSPLARLDVAGATNGTSPLFQLSSVASYATTTRFIVENGGNVGIGTSSPAYKLSVFGSDNNSVNSSNTGSQLAVEGDGHGIYMRMKGGTSEGISGSMYANQIFSRGGNIGLELFTDTNLVFGSGNTERMRIDSTGEFGIGTTSPLAKLDVAGSNNGTAPLFQLSSVASYATTTRLIVTNAGNVGIGTSSPTSLLSLSASSFTNGSVYTATHIDAQTTGMAAGTGFTTTYTSNSGVWGATGAYSPGNSDRGLGLWGGITGFSMSGAPDMYINLSGNVGIGTTSPLAKLDVLNTLGGSTALFSIASSTSGAGTTTAFYVASNGNVGVGSAGASRPLHLTNTLPLMRFSRGPSYDWDLGVDDGTYASNSSFILRDASVNAVRMAIGITGNVGVGTTTPWAQLSVNPNGITGPSFAIGSTTSTHFVVTNGGNVGIGTTSPVSLLTLSGSQAGITVDRTGNDSFVQLSSTGISGGQLRYVAADVIGIADANGNDKVAFNTSTGNVGIGTTSPQFDLTLEGNTNIDFMLRDNTQGADLKSYLIRNSSANLYIGRVNDNASTLTTYLTLQNGGNIGIGTTTPLGLLSVNPNGITGPAFVVGSSTATNFIVTNGGKVGIGTTTPVDALSVNGNVFADAFSSIGGPSRFNATGGVYMAGNAGSTYASLQAYSNSSGTGKILALNQTGGNVGIGTTSPSQLLHLTQTTAADTALRLESQTYNWTLGIDNSDAGKFKISSSTALGTSDRFVINGAGNVGIGVSNPAHLLQVYQSGNTSTALAALHASDYGLFVGTENSSSSRYALNVVTGINAGGTSGGSSVFYVRADGNVGIGTGSPSVLLHLASTTANVTQRWDSTAVQIEMQSQGSTRGSLGTVSNHPLRFITNNTERITISSAGLVGVGSTTPWAQLSVNPSGLTGPSFAVGSSTATNLVVTNAGLVGVGTTSPATLFEVGGSTNNVTFDGYKDCTGFTSNGNGLIACTASDERLKQDITALDEANGLAAINALRPVSFYWKPGADRGERQQYGLIAQQVQSVFPNLVTVSNPTTLTPDGMLSVDYMGFISPMVLAIQELDAKIGTQASSTAITLASLQDRITMLESGAVASASGSPITLGTTSLASALEGFGVLIQKGIAQFNTLVFRQLVASKDADGTSSAASVTIFAGNTVAQVNNSLVKASTKVFVTFNSQIAGSWWVSDKADGSFRIVLSQAQTMDVSFDYFLVQTEGQLATSTPQGVEAPGVTQSSGPDTVAPSITLLGDNPIRLSIGGTFVEPGVTITDNVSASVPYVTFVNGVELEATAATIDTSSPTTYIITYSATDAAGNNSTAVRSVIIGDSSSTPSTSTTEPAPESGTPADAVAPVVTLSGAAALELTIGDTFTDPGATATDDVDGDLTAAISVSGTVDTATAGTYTLTYTATDTAGNIGSVSRVVTVSAPVEPAPAI